MLFAKHPHRFFQTSERHGVHAVAHQLLDDANALAVLPNALGFGVFMTNHNHFVTVK